MSAEVAISEIKCGKRFRKDFGDIDELASSVERVGLLHPIVILPDNTLVVGERRLAAFKKLGRDTIPANVAENLSDIATLVDAECHENTCRKDFTPEEAVLIGGRIEQLAGKAAKTAQKDAGKAGAAIAGNGRPASRDSKTFTTPKQDNSKRTSAVAAKAVGMSHVTYEKAKAVVAAAKADPERQSLVDEMNRTGKVNGASKKLKVSEQANAIKAEPMALPEGPFRVITVDPPWSYDNRSEDPTHRASNPYPSMSIEEITEFRPKSGKSIPELAHDDCVLWLWTTNSHIREAFGIAESWGFTYKTLLTWDKVIMGTGDWLRGQTEHCLMCVKGKPVITLTNQTTVIREQRGKHSVKPEAFYSLVDSICPGNKVEIFSRTERDGWLTYGDETGSV